MEKVKTHGIFRAFLGATAFVYLTAKRYIRVANAICVTTAYTRYVYYRKRDIISHVRLLIRDTVGRRFG